MARHDVPLDVQGRAVDTWHPGIDGCVASVYRHAADIVYRILAQAVQLFHLTAFVCSLS